MPIPGSSGFEPTEIALRLGLACLLGAVLGYERELRHKAAGLRTHMMVCLGAAAFTLAALSTAGGAPAEVTRVIQGIVGGIGFLGAGQILQAGGSIQGITTAATIWVVGSIGIACGAGLLALAGITVVLAFAVLYGVNLIELRFLPEGSDRT